MARIYEGVMESLPTEESGTNKVVELYQYLFGQGNQIFLISPVLD
jgi:hypothetical protein